jgi:hypothetical protein
VEGKSSTEVTLFFVAFAPKDNQKYHHHFSGKNGGWNNHLDLCQFNDRKNTLEEENNRFEQDSKRLVEEQ